MNGHAKNKHLLGDSKYSLKKLDPKGNVDKWIEELNKLATSGKGTYKKNVKRDKIENRWENEKDRRGWIH